MRDPRVELDRLRQRIEDHDRELTARDRDALLRFSDQLDLLNSKYSDHRHLKLLRHCTRMAEATGCLADSLEDREATEEILRWINREYDNEETNRDYRSAIRVFGKRTLRMDEVPDSIAWVPTGTSRNYDPMPSEKDMLEWEDDVLAMIDGCRNTRDAAAIAVQFEAGLRGGELQSLQVGDVYDAEHAMGVQVEGKTGRRAVHLIVSTPYLQAWLDDHPSGDDRDPLWSKLSSAEEQSYIAYLNMFKLPAERAGITKPVTPTNFRKSNTRWLVKQGMSQARIEDRQGRTRGSEHTARYMARFGDESNELAYAAMHGFDVDDEEPDELAPLTCPRCDKETPRHEDCCVWCQQALSPTAFERLEATKDAAVDRMVSEEDVAKRELAAAFLQFVESNPNAIPDGAHDLLTSSSSSSSD